MAPSSTSFFTLEMSLQLLQNHKTIKKSLNGHRYSWSTKSAKKEESERKERIGKGRMAAWRHGGHNGGWVKKGGIPGSSGVKASRNDGRVVLWTFVGDRSRTYKKRTKFKLSIHVK